MSITNVIQHVRYLEAKQTMLFRVRYSQECSMFKVVRLTALLLMIWLTGCTASGSAFTPERPTNTDEALVYIYRPSTLFYSANPDVPILYIDDERLLRLRIGGYTWASVKAGTHKIVIRDSILGVAANTLGEVTINAAPGETYYLKFTQQSGDIIFYGPQVVVSANSKLRPVDDSMGAIEIRETKYLAPAQ